MHIVYRTYHRAIETLLGGHRLGSLEQRGDRTPWPIGAIVCLFWDL